MPRQAPSPLKTQREHRKIAPHPDDSRELDVLSIALSKCRVSEFLSQNPDLQTNSIADD